MSILRIWKPGNSAIRLTGKYGSQIVRRALMLKDRSPDMRIFNRDVKESISTYCKHGGCDPTNQVIKDEIPFMFASRQAQELAALTIRTPYLDKRFVEIMPERLRLRTLPSCKKTS